MSQALCCFCSRHESSVIVICESRCLLCNRCQNSVPVKKLLVDYYHKFGVYNAGYDSYASNASFLDINSNAEEKKIGCPICSQPLAPQMIQSIRMIIDQLQKTNAAPTHDETGRLFGDLDFKDLPNPFSAFIKRYRQTYNDPNAMIIGERPSTTDGNNDIKAPPITISSAIKKENQQLLMLEISNNRKLAAAATDVILDCYCNLWSLLLKNETESMTETAMKLCSRKKLSSKTNDLKAKSILDFFSSPAACTSAQFFMFGRILGLLPRRSNVIRQSWGPIALVITVLAYCDKCLRRGALIVKEGTPTAQEVRSKLGKAPGTKVISITRAFAIINFLIDSNQPHWCISPMSSSSIENNIPLPWSSDSKSRLVHLIFYALGLDSDDNLTTDSNGNIFTTESSTSPLSPANRRSSSPDIANNSNGRKSIFTRKIKSEQTEIPMTKLQSLESKAKQIWSCKILKVVESSGFTSLSLGKVINDKITNVSFEQASAYSTGLTLTVAELALICITAWETEYLYLEEYSSRAVIRRERRPAISGAYVDTQASAIPAEKFAIYRIMDFYERQGESGVDWQQVYDNFQSERKIFPFKIPVTLLSKSQAELDYLACSLRDEKEKQKIIERKEDLLAADGPYSKVLLKKSHAKLAGLDSVTYATVLNKIVSKKEYNQAYDVIGLSRDQRDALSRGQFIASQGLQGTDPFPEIDEEMKVLNLSSFPVKAAYPLPSNLDTSLPFDIMERTLTPHRLVPLDTSFSYNGDGMDYPQSEYIDLEDDDPFHPSTSDGGQLQLDGSVVSLDGPSENFDEEGRPKQLTGSLPMEEADNYTEDVLMLAAATNQLKMTEDAEHDRTLYTTTGLYTSTGYETEHVIPKTPVLESRPMSRGVALSKQPYSGPNPGRHAVNLVDVINHRNYDVLTEVGMLENNREPDIDNNLNDFSFTSPSRLNILSAARDRVRNKAVKNASNYETMFLNESIAESAKTSAELASVPVVDGNDTVRGLGLNCVGPNGENGGIVMNLNINNYIDKNEGTMESRRSAEIIVESISLCHTKITREGFASAMARYLNESQLLKLRKIDFSDNRLTYHAGIALANQLRHVCRLVHLRLDDNLLGDNGIGKILDAMIESGGAHSLARLEIRNNNITLGTKSLVNLANFKNIKALDLGNNCITVDTKHQKLLFISILQSLTNLVFLSLSNNKIKDDGFHILMNEIMPRDTIKRVDLSNCFITSKSIKLIQNIVTMECTSRKYDYFMLQGHIIGSELLPELRYMINNHSLNIFFEGNNSDQSNIEYPLLYDELTLNAIDNVSTTTLLNSKQSDHREYQSDNRRKATPKDYYDYEEQQKQLQDKERNANTTTHANATTLSDNTNQDNDD